MTPKQIELVKASFAEVAPIQEAAAALFYGRLFELDPNLRPLFKSDLKDQGRKLMSMLAGAVAGLELPERLIPTLRALAQRHVGYGVREEHYAVVGAALIWTLKQGLGGRFTDDVRQAWESAYALVASTMQDAARLLETVEEQTNARGL
jgi:hemoglobin-like flavoprotein